MLYEVITQPDLLTGGVHQGGEVLGLLAVKAGQLEILDLLGALVVITSYSIHYTKLYDFPQVR